MKANLSLSEQHYDYLQNRLLEERTFDHLKCVNCGHRFEHREKYYHVRFMPYRFALCEDCKSIANLLVDYEPKGSKEEEKRSWSWMRALCALRDENTCRLCGEIIHEVHHIIPRKDGGTHHLQNLICLCKACHKETFKQGYAGIETTRKLIAEGKQKVIASYGDKTHGL